jgi:hypothetical protein
MTCAPDLSEATRTKPVAQNVFIRLDRTCLVIITGAPMSDPAGSLSPSAQLRPNTPRLLMSRFYLRYAKGAFNKLDVARRWVYKDVFLAMYLISNLEPNQI